MSKSWNIIDQELEFGDLNNQMDYEIRSLILIYENEYSIKTQLAPSLLFTWAYKVQITKVKINYSI